MLTFEEWLSSDERIPKEKWTFKQYGDYALGWRNSMPWAYKGMSLAYDQWAEKRYQDFPYKEKLKFAWNMGMQNNYERLQRGDEQLSCEEAADLVLRLIGLNS